VLFTWGPWERLSDPTTPVAFHECFSALDPDNPQRVLYSGKMLQGIGELFGIVWGDKNVADGQLANQSS
jgi:hypothetical protein